VGYTNKKNYSCNLEFKYNYTKQFKEQQLIEEDDELKISLYERN